MLLLGRLQGYWIAVLGLHNHECSVPSKTICVCGHQELVTQESDAILEGKVIAWPS